jgi:hypothetical protein
MSFNELKYISFFSYKLEIFGTKKMQKNIFFLFSDPTLIKMLKNYFKTI